MSLFIVLAGIKLTSQSATDAQEALGLSYKRNYIDIYSNSWGPGMLGDVVGPRYVTSKALEEGVKKVRRHIHHICSWYSATELASVS